VASGFNSFLLTFEHLEYGPTLRHPRLLWARCVAGSALKELQAALMTAYGRTDTRPFRPHVTLARIPQNGRSAARKHPIDQPLSLEQCVRSVELFESPAKGQSGYRVLVSFPLGAGEASEPGEL
jgi:2'-5' RNA ligase